MVYEIIFLADFTISACIIVAAIIFSFVPNLLTFTRKHDGFIAESIYTASHILLIIGCVMMFVGLAVACLIQLVT